MADSENKTELAEKRTNFAEDRTVLANERTFAGWLRTGYAAVGIALAFNALFGRLEPPWLPKAIATGFLLIATLIFISAERRASDVRRRLDQHAVEGARRGSIIFVSYASIAATVALAAAIWTLDIEPPR